MRRAIVIALLGLALLARIMVPAGWMPVAGTGYAITLCTGNGAMSAWVDGDGTVHKGKPVQSEPGQPCAFSALSAAIDLPAPHGTAIAIYAVAKALFVLPRTAITIGHGLAAPPPPPTGPPVTR